MDFQFVILAVLAIGLVAVIATIIWRRQDIDSWLETYEFPSTIERKLLEKYPHLRSRDMELILDGLRSYFQICRQAGHKTISMPSQAVDAAWHEFILLSRNYRDFCDRVYGRFLYHTPAEAMTNRNKAQYGIQMVWRLACQQEGIDPKNPRRLPILFAVDGRLKIPDGYSYTLDCQDKSAGIHYCARSIESNNKPSSTDGHRTQ